MAVITLLDRQEAVRDLESRLRHALLIARLGGEPLVSHDDQLKIVRLLGHGASGVVCEAIDNKLQRRVALKLYPGLAHDALAQAVRKEAQALGQLGGHRNIVVVHTFDAAEFRPGALRCFYVVMELLSGKTLRHWMAESHSASDVLDVFCRAGDGLAAAHGKGIVHRDFKPENVMLDESGEPKLVDFGLAIPDPAASHLDSKKPEQRAIVGTLAYMAPEALRGHADARSDQFSFAAALWEALCGEFPYPIDQVDPGRRVVTTAPRSTKGLPPPLFDCLRRALHPDPSRRFPRMADLVARLRELHGELRSAMSLASAPTIVVHADLSSDTHKSAATTPAAAVPRRSWSWLAFPAVGAAAVVGVLAAAGLWSTAPPELLDAEQPLADDVPELSAAPPAATPPPAPAPPPPAAASFSCPVQAVKGTWLFKTLALSANPDAWRGKTGVYALDLQVSDRERCRFAATLYKSRGEQTLSVHGTVVVHEFPPFLGAGVGAFDIDGFRYDFFLAFESGQLRGDFHAESGKLGSFSGVLRGGRRESDRTPTISDDQPCATRCRGACSDKTALDRCRAQCSGDRNAEPRCSAP